MGSRQWRTGPLYLRAIILVLLAVGAVRALAAPTLDDQVNAIARELMCPTCSGQTVAESNAPLAQQMRAMIRERLQRGESREQILTFFVTQFGEAVLAVPPRRGVGLVLWVAPAVAFAMGLAVLTFTLRRMLKANVSRPGSTGRSG